MQSSEIPLVCFNQVVLFYGGTMECPMTLHFFPILTDRTFEYLNLSVISRVRCEFNSAFSQNAMLGLETNIRNQMRSRVSI
jgi:hypothetical protein